MTSAVRKSAAPKTEIGYAQAPAYNWWQYQDETTPELMWPQSISVYDAMRRTDSQVKSVLQAMTLPVRSTPWRVDPDGASDEVSEFVADNLGLPVVGMEPKSPLRQQDRFSWDDHIRLALLMLPFGHMYFEQVYRVDPDGMARIRKLGPRMPKTIEKIDVAEDGGLISITQYWTRTDRRSQPIPVDRLVAYVNEREGGNWLGNSILRPAYKNWLLKDRLLRVWAQTIERNGMGIPLYKGPEDATDLSTGLAMAKAWRAGEAAGSAVPFGADLTLVGVSGTLPDADPAVRYHDEQIGRAVLAHFLNLGTQTGSWALGTTFADFFTLSLQSLAMQIADTTTRHVVEDLVDINFGPDEPAPRVVFDEIGSRQPATAQSLVALFGAGALTPDERLEESLRQQYGLPPKQNEVDTGTDQPLIEEPAPIEVTARASYPGQKWRHGWKRIGDALMPKRGPAPSTAGPDSDRSTSMSDLAAELHGLHGGGKRKHLLDLGYDPDQVYALLGGEDTPTSMSDLAYELRGLSPGDKVNVLLAWGYLPDEIPDLLGMGRGVRAAGQAVLDRIDDRDTVESGQFDEDAAALVAALADFCGEIWAEADFNPDLHPRGAGGRFRSTFARIQRALTDWGNGDGPDDPLHAFQDREPLRQAAVKRGVKLKRGATREEIVDALLADARGKRGGGAEVLKPRASFTLKGGAGREGVAPLSAETRERLAKELSFQSRLFKGAVDATDRDTSDQLDELAAGVRAGSISDAEVSARLAALAKRYGGQVTQDNLRQWSREFDRKGRGVLRDLDVGVYVENKPNSRIFLRRESNGKPGTILQSFDDLDGLHAWASEHGETDLADWARSERGPAKKAATHTGPATGDEALALTAVTFRNDGERKAFDQWAGSFRTVNHALRENGGTIPADRALAPDRRIAASLDAALARSPLSRDIVVTRGIDDLSFLDGPPTVGAEWLDHGFNSTAARRPNGITGIRPGGAQMRITVPAGVHAVSGPGFDPDEVLLDRGLRYRVTKSEKGSDGVWHLDVEVVPAPSMAPVKRVPGKKAAPLTSPVAGIAAAIRDGGSEGEVVRLLDAHSTTMTPARLRELAADLGIDLPADVRSRQRLQSHIAVEASRRFGAGDGRLAERAPKPGGAERFDPSAVAERLAELVGDQQDLVDAMGDVTTVADLRRVATALNLPLPRDRKFTPADVRQYIAENMVRDRSRWALPGIDPRAKHAKKSAIPPAEQAALDRQVKVNRASSVHALVSEVDQLLTDGASDRALKARITSRAKVSNTPPDVRDRLLAAVGDEPAMRQVLADIRREEGLTPIGAVNDVVPFDPNKHRSIGDPVPRGAMVTVVKPGHRFEQVGLGLDPLGEPGATFHADVQEGGFGRPPAPSVPTGAKLTDRQIGDLSDADLAQAAADGRVSRLKAARELRERAQNIANGAAMIGMGARDSEMSPDQLRRRQEGEGRAAALRKLADEVGAAPSVPSEAGGSSAVPLSPRQADLLREAAGAMTGRVPAKTTDPEVKDLHDRGLVTIDGGMVEITGRGMTRIKAERAPSVPTKATPATTVKLTAREVDVDTRLRGAWRSLAGAASTRGERRVRIAAIRQHMADVPRAEQDAALRRLIGGPGVLETQENQQQLTASDRAAALRVGAREYHFVTFDNPADAAPRKAAPRKAPAKKAAPKVATSDVSTALIDAGDDTSAISSILAPLNSSQLKDLARQYGIKGASRMNRAQLVAALTEAVRRRNLASGVGETIAESAAKARGGS